MRISRRIVRADSSNLLKHFHWSIIGLSIITTLVTALTAGSYMNERHSGKLLIRAWPEFSYQERVKIFGEEGAHSI